MITRRFFCAAAPAATLAACAPREPQPPMNALAFAAPETPPLPEFYGAITTEPFPVPAVPAGVVPPRLWRQQVENPYSDEAPGTLIVDPDAGFLHLVEPEGRAMRYGAGTGSAARLWHGTARLQFRRQWPRWKAPDSMVARNPALEPYSVANGGMDPGPGNPLGARALYLFQDGVDTLYRVHGACEPEHLGRAVSSGCIRLLDQDAIDLHDRVRDGATVIVLAPGHGAAMQGVW